MQRIDQVSNCGWTVVEQIDGERITELDAPQRAAFVGHGRTVPLAADITGDVFWE
jgi:hypothetical protein